uniref:hypothetical protein n=1 Tax=Neorhizobium sp. EC2-8 TaxID=3129230 RepID=UPI0031016231
MIINTFSYLWKSTAIEAMSELIGHGFKVFEVPVSSHTAGRTRCRKASEQTEGSNCRIMGRLSDR